jgi:hypothetical protein
MEVSYYNQIENKVCRRISYSHPEILCNIGPEGVRIIVLTADAGIVFKDVQVVQRGSLTYLSST